MHQVEDMAVDTVDQVEITVMVLQQELTEALEEGKNFSPRWINKSIEI